LSPLSTAHLLVAGKQRAMVAAVTRTRFDQFCKQMVRDALESHGSVETDAEVPADTRRIDLWFTPAPGDTRRPEHLGWLGCVTDGASTLESFHDTPSGDELTACLVKHGQFRHLLSRRKMPPPLPTQWVISSGRPDGGIEGLGFHPMDDWPSGIYDGPPLLWTRLVVVNELPVARDTLLLRLFGAGAVLKQAIAELQALSTEAPERALALPVLLRLRLAVPTDPAKQTNDDQEFLMNTQDVVETWRREAIQEGIAQGLEQGVRQGLEQGERKLLLRLLQRRFGNQVDREIEQRIAEAPAEQIEVWAERVLSASTLTELLTD
jgi:hypothetical protein